MRLLTWNCHTAFYKQNKVREILKYKPDLAVIQECEKPETIFFKPDGPHCLWQGEDANANKGLCIFTSTEFSMRRYEKYDPSIKYCVPIRVAGKRRFNLIAVWAKNHSNSKLSHVGQVQLALKKYAEFILERDTIIVGDFNCTRLWGDPELYKPKQWAAKQDLTRCGLVNAYDEFHNKKNPNRKYAETYFQYYNRNKPYHVDYCFIPKDWVPKLKSVSVGSYNQYVKTRLSDHCPILFEFR